MFWLYGFHHSLMLLQQVQLLHLKSQIPVSCLLFPFHGTILLPFQLTLYSLHPVKIPPCIDTCRMAFLLFFIILYYLMFNNTVSGFPGSHSSYFFQCFFFFLPSVFSSSGALFSSFSPYMALSNCCRRSFCSCVMLVGTWTTSVT